MGQVYDIDSDAALDALLARETGIVEIRVKVGVTVTLRVPRAVRVVAGWLRASAAGAVAVASAAGAVAVASADGAVAVASADGARAEASAAWARAEASADGARAVAYEEWRGLSDQVTLEDVERAAEWASKHGTAPGEIGGATRRYRQDVWDCGTTCCVWGAAFLSRNRTPTSNGPSEAWAKQSDRRTLVAGLLYNPYATPEEIAAACRGEVKS